MLSRQPTEKQERVLDRFRQRAETGLPPTLRELCREFRWNSTGTARDYAEALRREGLVVDGAGNARGALLATPPPAAKSVPVVGRKGRS